MKPKLSYAQNETLKRLGEGRGANTGIANRTMEALQRMGLVEIYSVPCPGYLPDFHWRLTGAGKDLTEKWKAEHATWLRKFRALTSRTG